MRETKSLNLLRYGLVAICMVAALAYTIPTASAQYIRELNKGNGQSESSDQSNAIIYNPYIPQSTQDDIQRRAQPQYQQQQSESATVEEQREIGDALYREFSQNFQKYRTDSFKIDPAAPQASQLSPISTIPDDPMAYCKQYESKNPQQEDIQAYMENFLHERIKPASQMRLIVPKPCLHKVKEIAQSMLVDYSRYKRNELIMRAGNNKDLLAKAARTGNSFAQANLNYAQYANTECRISRLQASKEAGDVYQLTQACEIQMLKKRIQQIASM